MTGRPSDPQSDLPAAAGQPGPEADAAESGAEAGDGPEDAGANDPGPPGPNDPGIRADKWLWFARFFKSRTLAGKMIQAGHLRVSGTKATKANTNVRAGDVLTFPQGRQIRVIRVLALGTRRGPASEARTLFRDLEPPKPTTPKTAPPPGAKRPKGAGRPTKRERRELDRLHGRDDEI